MIGERVPNNSLLSLEGKTALVTGAAMGIGFEIAKRLCEANASVVISDINDSRRMGMSKSLALELAPHGITVNVIAPGDIDTPGSRSAGIEPEDLSTKRIPLGRQGTADDIAREVLVLASRVSDYTTGTIRIVDGGWMLTSSNTIV